MSSGVAVADQVITKYNQIKLGKSDDGGGKLRYVIFKIKDKKEIVFDTEGDASKTFDDFKTALPEDEPRYALVDIDYKTDDGRGQTKLTFVMWSPDDKAGVKPKMLYASSKDAIKKKCTGIMKELQANDMSDLEWSDVEAKMNQK